MNTNLDIKITTQSFNNSCIKITLNGFILSYASRQYIITLHHNLPIESIECLNTNTTLDSVVNSKWSEVLVCKNDLMLNHENNFKVFRDVHCKLPKEDTILNVIVSNNKLGLKEGLMPSQSIELLTVSTKLIPYDNLDPDILIPYISAKFIDTIENIAGLSGSPVLYKDKVIGVFSKYDHRNLVAYIIPIHIVIKNIEKKDNNIYKINIDNIKKINSYNVKDNEIYYPQLKINIPLNTFCVLEGDIDNQVIVTYIHDGLSTTSNTNFTHSHTRFSNECDLVTRSMGTEYKITSRFLCLLRRMLDCNLMKYLLSRIQNSKLECLNRDLWLVIRDNKIIINF